MVDHEVKRTKGSVVHPRVMRAMEKLGQDISTARRARGIGVEEFAQRIGVSRGTLYRLEIGEPGVTLNTLAMALHALGRLDALTELVDAGNDDITLMQMKDQTRRRIDRPRPVQSSIVEEEVYDDTPPALPPKYMGF